MRTSLRGREELVARVQQALALPTKKEAERIVETVVEAVGGELLNHAAIGDHLPPWGFATQSVTLLQHEEY